MASIVQLKRSALSGKVPGTGSLNLGELALNTYDGKIFFRRSGSTDTVQEVITSNTTNTGSVTITGTLTAASIVGSISASNGVVSGSSQVIGILSSLNSYTASVSGTFATTGSNTFNGNQTFNNDVTVLGAINARQFNIGIISSSILYQSGSTKFGDTQDDIMQVTGSLVISGSSVFTGSVTAANGFTGSIRATNATFTNGIAVGQLSIPTLSSAVTSSAIGGTIPAGTYYYKITALDFYGRETTASNEVSTTVTGSTSTITISWAAIAGTPSLAAAYKVYRSTTSNTYGSYVVVNGINTKTFTDTNQAVTSGSIPTVNNTSYGFLDSSQLRTNNITLVNNGIGNTASLTFEKSTDSAAINVVEYLSDATMFEFKTSDNPDGASDFFHWFVGDYQNPSSGWKPLKLTNFTNQFVAQNTNFWSSFNLPSNTPYYTTNPDTLANSAIKGDPYVSTTYSLVKDSGSGTGVLNVDVTGFTGTTMRTYWIAIASPTTFNWGINSQAYGTTLGTGVTITGAFQTLDNGLQIKLSAGGQVAGDKWSFRAFPTPKFVIGKSTTGNAPFDLLGNALITGSLGISGSVSITGSITATSFTGSIAATNGVISGSSQLTASYDLRYALSGSSGGANSFDFNLDPSAGKIGYITDTTENTKVIATTGSMNVLINNITYLSVSSSAMNVTTGSITANYMHLAKYINSAGDLDFNI